MALAFGSDGPKFDSRQQPLVQLGHKGDSNNHTQAHKVFSLISRLSNETLNRGPVSVTPQVPAHEIKHFSF